MDAIICKTGVKRYEMNENKKDIKRESSIRIYKGLTKRVPQNQICTKKSTFENAEGRVCKVENRALYNNS